MTKDQFIAIVGKYQVLGAALSVANDMAVSGGREVIFAHDIERIHSTFRSLAKALGYAVAETDDGPVMVPVRTVTIDAEVIRPVFGKRGVVTVTTPDGDGPKAA